MVDNVTGESTPVNFHPVQLEVVLRTRRERGLMMGWVMTSLVEAAKRLWPEFQPLPEESKPMVGYALPPLRVEADPNGPYMPRWRRRILDPDFYDDDNGGL